MSDPNPRDLPVLGIDVLRIFAALAVMLYHLGFKALADPDGALVTLTALPSRLPGSWAVTWWGWIGVQIFFVISGLVIANSAMRQQTRPLRFAYNRALRLMPVIVIAACIAVPIELVIFGTSPLETALLWLRTVFFAPLPPWIMGQFWTLGIEVAFYALVFGLLLMRRAHMLPQVAIALIGLSGAYWTLRIAGGGTDAFGRGTQLLLLQHGVYFGIGILLAHRGRGAQGRVWPLAILAALPVCAAQIAMAAGWEAGAQGLAYLWPVPCALFCLTLLAAEFSFRWNVALHRRFAALVPAIRVLGLITFPLYLLHNHIGKPLLALGVFLGLPLWAAVTLAGLGAFALSWCVAVCAEPAARAWLGRIAIRRPAASNL